jgi:hypothetical protein
MVKVGQVYADKDKREAGRHLRVVETDGWHAKLARCTPAGDVYKARLTQILVVNLERRFRLVKDAEADTNA